MRLDHFVVHVDADSAKLKQLALDAAVAGMPCDPAGKGKERRESRLQIFG